MDNPYQPPSATLKDRAAMAPAMDVKLYKVWGIGWATFVGSVFAGGLLMALNYKRLGMPDQAGKTLWWSGFATVLIIGLALFEPEKWNIPNLAYTIPQLLVMLRLADARQGSYINAHQLRGGRLVSNWIAVGIALLVFAVLAALMFGVVYGFDRAGLFVE